MKRFVFAALAAAGFCGLAAAQDLPPEKLIDQYMLEAKRALDDTTRSPESNAQGAFSAFERIEALVIDPPLEFRFFVWQGSC